MVWPRRLGILWNLVHSSFGILFWVVCAAGALAAVLLHRKEKKPLFWPALCAAVLWFACEVAGVNLRSYMGEFIVLVLGIFVIGYGVGWLIMDIVYLLKK